MKHFFCFFNIGKAAWKMSTDTITKELVICNSYGLHIRPISMFVQTAMQYESEVDVENVESSQHSDGKSVMGMLMLSATKGTRLNLVVTGKDCKQAAEALAELVNRGFDED